MSYFIPGRPQDDQLFAYSKGQKDQELKIIKENTVTYIIDKIEKVPLQGIQVYYKDIPYPRKGFPYPEAVNNVNFVKKVFIEAIKLGTLPEFILALSLLILLPTRIKKLQKLVNSFNRACYGVISEHLLKPEYMTPLASELQGILYVFLARLGLEDKSNKQFAKIFCCLIEYDSAYRFRMEDIFSETTKEKLLENPYKECKRLTDLFLTREHLPDVKNKLGKFFKLTLILLKLPSIKKSFKLAIKHSEFQRLQYDKADLYWITDRYDYDFLGLTYEERTKNFTFPQKYSIQI